MMKFISSTIVRLAGVALCGAYVLSYAAPASADPVTQWSQFLGNPSHSSYIADSAISTANASTMGVKWMANLFSSDLGSPVVAFNSVLGKEVVYVGDERADVYAIDANSGQIIWSTNVGYGDAIRATPAVASDGTVWVGTNFNGSLYKLNGATGQVECSQKSPNMKPVMGSPMLATPPGGSYSVFWNSIDSGKPTFQGPLVGSNESTCSQNWLEEIDSGAWTTPAMGVTSTGTPLIFLGTADPASDEYAVNALTGSVAWKFQTYFPPTTSGWDIGDAATVSAPGVNGFADGVVYVSNEYGYEYALDMATGTPIWTYHTYPDKFGGKRYIISSAALDGNQMVYGYFNGLVSLNASTGGMIWNWNAPAGVDSSPAIVGPAGNEVVAFADLTGAFRIFTLGSGSQLYSYQTGSYVSASPAEYNGTIFLTSADGFLYAFTPGGGNGAKPSEAIASPANGSVVANPNGSLVISGSATDGSSVKAVEIALQSSGSSGPWYDGASNSWNSAPVRNEATLASPGAATTTWSYSVPVPAGGGTYKVYANVVNGANIVDKGATSYFTVSASNNEPTVHTSMTDTPPGTAFTATGNAFKPGETVTFTLLGNTVGTAVVGKTGNVPQTAIQVAPDAPFGPTSLTLTGNSSGKVGTATIFVTNEWAQYGYGATKTGQEPHDDVIAKTIFVGGSVLNVYWTYASGAPIDTSPAIVNGIAYFGNDNGTLSAVNVASGAPAWTHRIASSAPIKGSPAVDSSGQVIFGANDGNLYVLNNGGQSVGSVTLGGHVGAPAYANGTIVVASDSGMVYSVSDPGLTTNWSANAGSAITTPPAFDAKAGLVVVGTAGGNVVAYSSTTGAVKWTGTTGGAIAGLAIAGSQVYAGSADGNVYAFAENSGTLNWKLAGDGTAVTALDANGTGPAFGTASGNMFDVGVTGKVYYTRHHYANTAIQGLAGAGTDEFSSGANGFLMLMRVFDGGWHYPTNSSFGPGVGPVVLDGMLFGGANDGNFYAFTPQGYTPPPQTSVKVGSAIVTVNGNCTPGT